MTTEIRVPILGESVTEATIASWFKKKGEAVRADEPVVELETDKVTIEVPAPSSGVIREIAARDGDTVEVGALLGSIAEDSAVAAAQPATVQSETVQSATARPTAKSAQTPPPKATETVALSSDTQERPSANPPLSPAVRKIIAESGTDSAKISRSGKGGRILKGDVLAYLQGGDASLRADEPSAKAPRIQAGQEDAAREERVRMTSLRKTIARRLKDAQNTAAMLTTFNEVDMSAIMTLRNEYKVLFEKKHSIKLGFMSFFVKACVQALKEIPEINAEIDGGDLIYKNYYHIGVAVGTNKGLVVPVVRNGDALSLADIEKTISTFAASARDGQIKLEDIQGGTFTISNGGVYGSLMSTPILNAPQSGILGMHKIQQRAIAVDGKIELRPMMYLALSYDHRIVDGREAVTFLVRVKDMIEAPQRLLLDL
ncbi:MAG: 2-oxoglutarate dehydrogenase complex dihydrolipoyllysine-residue succinyltransferase [Hyphomicrobiales bacterium]